MPRPPEARCPVLTSFDPSSGDFIADPLSVLDGLRSAPRVFYAPRISHYVLTRYSDIENVCLDPETYSSASAQVPVDTLIPEARALLLEGGKPAPPSMLSLDPPAHGRLRLPVARAFSERRITRLASDIGDRARSLIDAIPPSPVIELVSRFCSLLPSEVIFRLIGVPETDWDQMRTWCAHRSALVWGISSPDDQIAHASNVAAYRTYLRDVVAGKRPDSQGDFTESLLATREEDKDALSLSEIASILYSLTFAGQETTSYLIGNAVRQLLRHDSGWTRLVQDRALIPSAVNEVIRYDPSVPTMQRVTTRPVIVGDVRLPRGAKVLLWIAAAGRDPLVYPAPEVFDVSRSASARQIGLGFGAHSCVGAALGKLEARLALDALVRKYPEMTLVKERKPIFDGNIAFRGAKEVWVRPGSASDGQSDNAPVFAEGVGVPSEF